MKKTYDAIVVGAGLAGLSAAWELARRKLKVLVLERETSGKIGNASRAAAGFIDPYSEAEGESALFRLSLRAQDFYPSFLKELGPKAGEEIEFKRTGMLYLAFNSPEEASLKKRFRWQKQHHIPVEAVSSLAVRRLEKSVSPKVRSGMLYPEIEKLNAGKLAALLFDRVRRAVEIKTSVPGVLPWKENGQIRGVRTAADAIEAPVVVWAAGSWSSLHPRFGVKVKVKPVRGQILILKQPPSCPVHRILHTLRYAYIVPWPGRRLLVGSTLESAGFRPVVTPAGRAGILNRAAEILPGIKEFPIETSWAGLRPRSESGRPLIGPAALKGFYLATGYYRSGILISPLAGKLLAEGIVSGKFSSLLKPFFPAPPRKEKP